jgi:hypothetical protein
MPTLLPAFRLNPEPLSPEAAEAQGFDWAEPEVGRRHQLGGEPRWLQQAAVPRCPSCEEPMSFYAQLDGIGDAHGLADCGLIYVFVCFADFDTKSILQSA